MSNTPANLLLTHAPQSRSNTPTMSSRSSMDPKSPSSLDPYSPFPMEVEDRTLVYVVLHHRKPFHDLTFPTLSSYNVSRTVSMHETSDAAHKAAHDFVKLRGVRLAVGKRDIEFESKMDGDGGVFTDWDGRNLSREEDWWESWVLTVHDQLARCIMEGKVPNDLHSWVEGMKVVGKEIIWVERQWLSRGE